MMLAAIMSLTVLGFVLGGLLGLAARYLKVEGNPLAEEIAALLPGTQCGQCGFPGCTPAAEALVAGNAPVSLCPPGGRALAEVLAKRLGIDVDLSGLVDTVPKIAKIVAADCTGCTRCFKRCPTDAIVGAAHQLHVVFAEACTGCGLCVEACPTNGIVLKPIAVTPQTWYWQKPVQAC